MPIRIQQLNNRRAGLQHRRSLLLNRPDVILKLILKNRRFYICGTLTCVTLSTRRLLESTTALRCSAHLVSSAATALLHGQNQKTAQINTFLLLLLLMLLLPPEGQQRGGDSEGDWLAAYLESKNNVTIIILFTCVSFSFIFLLIKKILHSL